MAKPKTTPRPLPSDDSKVAGASANNVTPIKGRARRQATDDASGVSDAAGTSAPGVGTEAPAVIVFGKDEAGKAHASWFSDADAALAERAAGLMGYRVLPVSSPDIAAKALELAAGRIFAQSGRGFVPFCRTALYDALNGFEGAFAPPPPPPPQPEPEIAVVGPAASWDTIDVGHLVLAAVDGDEQWWPSLVAEARGEDIFVLKWLGYPDEPAFVRRRDGLGLLPPAQPIAAIDPGTPADPVA